MKKHTFNKHDKDLTSHSKKDHGKSTDRIPVRVYNTSNVKKYTQDTDIIIKFAFPGCRNIFNTASELENHVNNNLVKITLSLENLSPEDKRWVLDGRDISSQFHKYRRYYITASRTAKFAAESRFNELLAMSDLPTDIFSPSLLRIVRTGILVKYKRNTFHPHIIQQSVDEDITETRSVIELLPLCDPVVTSSPQDYIEPTEYGRAVIMAIVALLSYLYDCDMKPLSEAHLTSSYIHPFIHGLLSAKKPSKAGHCSNIVLEEFDNAVDRPDCDYKIDVYASSGYRLLYTSAYGEVKNSSSVSVTLLANDFYRLCIFSKEAIELVRLRISTKKCDLLDLMGHADNLLFVVSLIRDYCMVSENDLAPWRCNTLSSAYLDVIKKQISTKETNL
ncbi:hypothetical protein J3Q64DRAFT_1813304 [Phycomyces blakesleeanus]|uniref:C2H2-type zinc finger transcription factor n=1 Tax=Phycomyces blakesleeanus TaxID=4837 RepID=A0ABR3B6Y9_PHYBL